MKFKELPLNALFTIDESKNSFNNNNVQCSRTGIFQKMSGGSAVDIDYQGSNHFSIPPTTEVEEWSIDKKKLAKEIKDYAKQLSQESTNDFEVNDEGIPVGEARLLVEKQSWDFSTGYYSDTCMGIIYTTDIPALADLNDEEAMNIAESMIEGVLNF